MPHQRLHGSHYLHSATVRNGSLAAGPQRVGCGRVVEDRQALKQEGLSYFTGPDCLVSRGSIEKVTILPTCARGAPLSMIRIRTLGPSNST